MIIYFFHCARMTMNKISTGGGLRFIYFTIFDSYLSYFCLALGHNCSTVQGIVVLQEKVIRVISFQPRKTQRVSFNWSNNTRAADVEMNKMLGLTVFSNLNLGSYIISNAKAASRKTEVFVLSIKFLSLEVTLYLCKSTIRPFMKYCCHVWAGTPNCYLNLLVKLQKRICWTIGSSLLASLEPLAPRGNVARFSLFCKIYFGRCLSELAELVSLPYSRGRYNCYSHKLP